eukprot:1396470-Pleurochrysis_carterae.AAC.1
MACSLSPTSLVRCIEVDVYESHSSSCTSCSARSPLHSATWRSRLSRWLRTVTARDCASASPMTSGALGCAYPCTRSQRGLVELVIGKLEVDAREARRLLAEVQPLERPLALLGREGEVAGLRHALERCDPALRAPLRHVGLEQQFTRDAARLGEARGGGGGKVQHHVVDRQLSLDQLDDEREAARGRRVVVRRRRCRVARSGDNGVGGAHLSVVARVGRRV